MILAMQDAILAPGQAQTDSARDCARAARPSVGAWVSGLRRAHRQRLQKSVYFWSNGVQRLRDGDWRTMVILGGRGSGKTYSGAAVVADHVATGRARRIALIGPTHHAVRAVMVEGPSGLLRFSDFAPTYEASLRRISWANGAVAELYSAEEIDRLRGPQFDFAWGDEVCFWPDPQNAIDTLRMAMRLGACPRLVLTSTPRPGAFLGALLRQSGVARLSLAIEDNLQNLSPAYLSHARDFLGEGLQARLDIDGEVIDAEDGALWTLAQLTSLSVAATPPLDRVIVAIDPPATSGAASDACGIVAVGVVGTAEKRTAYVLADATLREAAPHVWAKAATDLARALRADCLIAEANMGGEMVRSVLALADPHAPVRLVRATLSKQARAAPIALQYQRGRVFHVGRLPALEAEMTENPSHRRRRSPDRMDALVWALTEAFADDVAVSIRRL